MLRKQLLDIGFKGRHVYTRDYLLNHLRELAKKVGRTPGMFLIRKDGTLTSNTYVNFFGSIRKAQKAAGLTPNKTYNSSGNSHRGVKPERFSDDYMLDYLRALAKELGRKPKSYEINSRKKINVASYYKHFGSLTNAIKKAGLI
ncbi:MAG: hypothetical protein JJE25_00085 [Bacteroidia bacterium]|nr:hypothetical protein [Bacteroidia bacterium]